MADNELLERAYGDLCARCEGTLAEMDRGNRGPVRVIRPAHEKERLLASEAEGSAEFRAFEAALPLPVDSGMVHVVAAWPPTRLLDGVSEWFLRRVGFYRAILDGQRLELAQLLDRWNAQRHGSRRLYVLELAAVPGPVVLPGARLCPLTDEFLDDYFATRCRRAFGRPVDHSSLVGFTGLEVSLDTYMLEDFYMGPDRSHPWLAYLNLLTPWSVKVLASFETAAFLTEGPDYLGEMPRERLYDPTRRPSIEAAAIDQQLQSFELVRQGSAQRVDIALKCFARGCAAGLGEDSPIEPAPEDQECYWGRERDDAERALIDFATAMEAVFLDRSHEPRTSRLAVRAGCLLGADDCEAPEIRRRVSDAYNVRSRVVHGDESPPWHALVGAAEFLRKCLRRSLVALLRMDGDQSRIIAGVDDPAVRAQNRTLVPD